MTRVRDEVRAYVVQQLLSGDDRGFTDDTDLQDSGILDSFGTLELLQFIERTFAVSLGAGQVRAGGFRTVNAIVQMIEDAGATSAQ
jgi:acyl carrier protein